MRHEAKVEFGSTEHLLNVKYSNEWLRKFQRWVVIHQDFLEGHANDECLMEKGHGFGKLCEHEGVGIAVYVSWAPPPRLRVGKIAFFVSLLMSCQKFEWELEQAFAGLQSETNSVIDL